MKKARIIYYPKPEEIKYRNELLKFVKTIEQGLNTYIMPVVKAMSGRFDDIRHDDFVDELEQALENVRNFIKPYEVLLINRLISIARSLGNYTTKQVFNSLQNNVEVGLNNLAVDIFAARVSLVLEERYKVFALENAMLIRSIEEQLLSSVAVIVMESYKSGTGTEDIADQIYYRVNVSENRAKLIARDQIGKLHSKIIQDEAASLNIDYYVFSDSDDEQTRTSHHAMHNKICKFDDPTVYKDSLQDKQWKKRSSIGAVELHPGIDYNCRCNFIFVIP